MKALSLSFLKMHGAGNDFVVVLDRARDPAIDDLKRDPARAARLLCDRRRGVGADQLLLVSETRMDIWNPDGSRAEMCGNGVRCAAEFLDRRLGARPEWFLDTLGGLQKVRRVGAASEATWAVEMAVPKAGAGFSQPVRLDLEDDSVFIHEINVGNPHVVAFVDHVDVVPLEVLGPELEHHERFAPGRTNVEFVEVVGASQLRVRVWERGTGITQACGTGATASAVAAILKGRVKAGWVEVQMPGGLLKVKWEREGQPAVLQGEARVVFEGTAQLSILESGLM